MSKSSWVFVLFTMFFPGCYRPEVKEFKLVLPDAAGNPEELNAVKSYLTGEEDRLREGLTLYRKIEVQPEDSLLVIHYYAKHLADQNILTKVQRLGYAANGLPGNEETLRDTRNRFNLR